MNQQMATSDTNMKSFQNANLDTESSEMDPQSLHRYFFSFFFPFCFQRKITKKPGIVQETMLQFNHTASPFNEGENVMDKTAYARNTGLQ